MTTARRRWVAVALALLVVAAGVVVGLTDPFAPRPPASKGVAANAFPASLATVTRQNLSSQTEVDATLGYASSYRVVDQAQGIVTALPGIGHVVSQGHVLYEVSGQPVVLLYGATPAYRSLSEGTSATDLTGRDVEELNADLVALGYVTRAELSPTSDRFSGWTKVGVDDLQAALGVTRDGTLALGQVVFLPTAPRVTTVSAILGAPVAPGQPVMTATSTTREVSVAIDAAQQSEVAVGDKVTITLPDSHDTPGVISSVGTVATAGAAPSTLAPTVMVLVKPTDPAATGGWDQAPVEVSITTGSVDDALVVPVDALLALSGGGYAAEVVGADGIHRLVAASLGLFDDADGLVQVTGPGLAAGQRVVVPAL